MREFLKHVFPSSESHGQMVDEHLYQTQVQNIIKLVKHLKLSFMIQMMLQ